MKHKRHLLHCKIYITHHHHHRHHSARRGFGKLGVSILLVERTLSEKLLKGLHFAHISVDPLLDV